MPEKPIAFIFPAFVTEYPADPFSILPEYSSYCQSYLLRAAAAIDPELEHFNYNTDNFLGDELRTQLMTYIICCAYAEVLKENNVVPSVCAGYSMGIYAAAYQAGSITFEDGLLLIQTAFHEISRITAGERYGMGTVLGLKRDDIDQLLDEVSGNVEIANQNSSYSFILSGLIEELKLILDRAQNEGALNVRLLNVTIPYHSYFLKETRAPFTTFIKSLSFKHPETPIVSLIDRSMLKDSGALKNEIVRNLYTHLNWYQTQLQLQNSGVKSFIECGPGKTLVKNAKFVEGESAFYSVSSLFDP